MKVVVEHMQTANIPALHVYREELAQRRLPFVIFIHGFTNAKEDNLHIAYLLAEKGFRVVLPDAIYHGERDENLSEMELAVRFWQIVLNVIKELEWLKNDFAGKGLIDENKIGVFGTSMGGIATLGALTQYPWIQAAASLMGSPNFQEFFQYLIDTYRQEGHNVPVTEEEIEEQFKALYDFDLSQHKEALNNRPLFFWHGMKDQVVPFQPTYRFYEEIKPLYAKNPENLKFFVEEQAGHKVSRKGVLLAVNWFVKHLK